MVYVNYILHRIIYPLWVKLINLNLYDSHSDDPLVQRKEIQATRFYVVILSVTISILTVYSSLSLQEKSKSMVLPSEDQYRSALEHYPNTLTCKCTDISIPYRDFMEVEPLFHQLCDSSFISQEWIDYTFNIDRSTLWPMDIRVSLSHVFQLIRFLCETSINNFNTTTVEFTDRSLTGLTLLSPSILEANIQTTLNSLHRTVNDLLQNPLQIIHSYSNVRGLMTGLGTNSLLLLARPSTSRTLTYGRIVTATYQTCECYNHESCPILAGIYLYDTWNTNGSFDLDNIVPNYTIPGMITNCLPFQTLSGSTLECFYNESCVRTLMLAYPTTFNISVLNSQQFSRYRITDTIERLIDNSFIENLTSRIDFSSYYKKCAPTICTFRYFHRFDSTYILAILLSFMGGLNTVFSFISPHIINLAYFLKTRRLSQSREPNRSQNNSLKLLIIRMIEKLKDELITLNLFTKNAQQEIKIRRGRIASRLYVVFLIICTIILTFYTATKQQVFNEIIVLPSRTQYLELQAKYQDTIKCPCSEISVTYDRIINFDPIFHQICSSDFIRPSWYNEFGILYITSFDKMIPIYYSSIFRIYAAICKLSTTTVHRSIQQFRSNTYIHSHAIPKIVFNEELNSMIDRFVKTTIHDFFYTKELVDAIIQAEQYISMSLLFNVEIYATTFGSINQEYLRELVMVTDITSTSGISGSCSCTRDGICIRGSPLEAVIGSCLPLIGVLSHSLQQLYEPENFQQLRTSLSYLNISSPTNTTFLNPNQSTRFSLLTSAHDIFNELMVENWTSSIDYDGFYRNCLPMQCSYSYTARPGFLLLISIISGVIGGLNRLLRLLCPILTRIIIRERLTHVRPFSSTNSIISRFYRKLRIFKQYLITLNYFSDENVDSGSIIRQRVATWFYIMTLAIIITVTVIFSCISSNPVNVHIQVSSIEEYEVLKNTMPSLISCPCSKINPSFKSFVEISVTFHQVCSSDFISKTWIHDLYGGGQWNYYEFADFRKRGAAHFSLLGMLCNLSQITVSDAIDSFLDEVFIATQLISENEFNAQLNHTIDRFIMTVPSRFNYLLHMLNKITHANTFISIYLTNWHWPFPMHETMRTITAIPTVLTDGCSCSTRTDCIQQAGIFNAYFGGSAFDIPGFYIGCSSVQTVLQSSLECFYSNTCIDHIYLASASMPLELSLLNRVQPMNVSLPTHYRINTPIADLVAQLFIEKWKINISYPMYYNQCSPTYCIHERQQKKDILSISTLLLSVYGGSIAILRVISPHIAFVLIRLKKLLCGFG